MPTAGFRFMRAVRFGLGSTYLLDLAPQITLPVLLIQGVEDRVNPTERNAAILVKALPNAAGSAGRRGLSARGGVARKGQ